MEPEKEIVSYLRKYGNTKENDLVDFGIKKLGFSSEEMKRTLTCLVVKGRIHRIVHNRLEPPVSYVSLTESLPPENIENFMEAGVPEDMTKEATTILEEAAKLAEKIIGERFTGSQYRSRDWQ